MKLVSTVATFFVTLGVLSASSDDAFDDGYIVDSTVNHEEATSRALHKQRVTYAPSAPVAVVPQYVQRSVPVTRIAAAPVAVQLQRPMLISPAAVPVCRDNVCGPSVATAPHVVVEREEVTRIIRERSCPEGMSLEGDVCIGLDVCPVNFVCPPGTVAGPDGRCVTKLRPLIDCPVSYTLSRGRCSACESIPAQLTCRAPDFLFDPASNICTKAVDQPAFCPPAYVNNGGRCEQRVPSQPTCPAGFNLSVATRECVRNINTPPQVVCPDGASLVDNNRCVIVRQDPPRCPPRFTFDPATQTCVQSVNRVPGECSYGFNRVGASCERVDRIGADFFCPPDFQPIGNNQCLREIPIPPRCPPGMQHSSASPGHCERCVKEVPTCPEGSRPVGQGPNLRCEIRIEQPSIECCAPGFNLVNGQCRRVEQLAAVLTCENECYETRGFPVAYTCPDDAEFVDHPVSPRCVRTNSRQVCETPAPIFTSPPTGIRCLEEINEKTGQPHAANDSTSGSRQLKGGLCTPLPTQITVTPAPVCREVPQNDSLPAQPYCPNGGELEGNRCVVRSPIVPERICKIGVLDHHTGQCVRETVIPVKSDCPPGTQRQGKTCFSVEMRQPDYICPQGSEPSSTGVCLVLQPEILSAPQVSRLNATPRCAVGVLSGAECLQSSREALPTVCPTGTHETGNGDCLLTAELVVPPPIEKFVRPSHVCVSGVLSGRLCVDAERLPIEEVCPAGTTGYGGTCMREAPLVQPPPRIVTSPAVPVCPPGSSIRGTTCVSTHETEPLVSCAVGFFLEGSECVKTLDKLPICPEGTELSGEGCVRRVSVAPLIKIVRGCVHEAVAVCDTCPRRLEKTCHAY